MFLGKPVGAPFGRIGEHYREAQGNHHPGRFRTISYWWIDPSLTVDGMMFMCNNWDI